MKVEIKVPAMGESISEATIGTLLKSSGSQVAADEEVVELETDKVNQVLYAPQAGTIKWNVKQGDVVKIGQVIGDVDSAQQGMPVKESKKEVVEEVSKPVPENKPVPSPAPTTTPASPQSSARGTKEMFLSELSSEKPPKAVQATPPALTKAVAAPNGERKETRKKMSKIRKVIANRLVDVLQETAMLTTFNEVDMTKIIDMRESYKESFTKQYNVRLGYMSFFVKAVISALKAFPEVNAYIDGDEIVTRDYFDIGIAIGTDRGVIVPVVKNCDQLSFADIERSIENFAKKAREGGLSADDLQGGSFTITNGGTYGSLFSTPILNPPQSAILGMHKIMKRPIVVDDEIVIRQMMYLAMSYDHRIIDGKEAVSFLVHIKNCLEDPARILIEI